MKRFLKTVSSYTFTAAVYTVLAVLVLAIVIPIVTFVGGHVCLVVCALVWEFFPAWDLGVIGVIGAATFIFDAVFLPFLIPIFLIVATWLLTPSKKRQCC
ncbi:MAG: hypothetical protein ABIH67_04765 [Candidatus Uhrbacteria bacterium]